MMGYYVTSEEADRIAELYAAGYPIKEIVAITGRSDHTIRGIAKERDIPKRPRGAPRGERHGRWKGGQHSHAEGYILRVVSSNHPMASMGYTKRILVDGSRMVAILEHRLVMAENLGRILQSSETVHHINGNPSDNRIENLELRQGHHGTGIVMQCNTCGSCDVSPRCLA